MTIIDRIKKTNKFSVLIIFFIIFIPLWHFLVAPFLTKIPNNFTYRANVTSVDNFFDETTNSYKGEQYSKTTFSYDVVGQQGNYLAIKNTFEVRTHSGDLIFKAEPVYGINALTGEHVKGYGDKDRSGYLFAPRGIKAGESFTYWHASTGIPGVMKYVGEETLYGVTVFKYETDYGGDVDQTPFMGHLPNVPEKRGIKLHSKNTLWIEPVSGYLVKQEDYSVDYYYYDVKTGERIASYNKFVNTFSEESIHIQSEIAASLRSQIIFFQYVLPIIFFVMLVILILLRLGFLKRGRLFWSQYRLSIFVLVITLSITFTGYFVLSSNAEERNMESLSPETLVVDELIQRRMEVYSNALVSGRALFDTKENITRDDWKRFVGTLKLQENFPGILGMGYSRVVQPKEKQSYITNIRKEGFPNFSITPEGERDVYVPVTYIEPFDENNQKAFGFDLYSEEIRRLAMSRARDEGVPIASGRITLIQDQSNEKKEGFLMVIPVYKFNTTPKTVEERRKYITGYIYIPFRINEVMDAVLGNTISSVTFKIHDGLRVNEESLIYRYKENIAYQNNSPEIIFRKIDTIYFAGHPWTIEYQNSPEFKISFIDKYRPTLVLIVGFLVSFLSFGIVFVQIKSKSVAVNYAKSVTKDLEANVTTLERTKKALLNVLDDVKEEKLKSTKILNRLKLATSSAKIGVWEWDVVKNVLKWDDTMYMLYGIKKENFSGAYEAWQKGLHPDDKKAGDDAIQAALKGEKDFNIVFRVIWPNGEIRYIQAHAFVERDEKNNPLKMVGVNWDITHEKETDQIKSDFISLASHQLRTPLTTLNWNLEVLLNQDLGKINDKQRQLLDVTYEASQRMVKLVNALLNVSRIEANTYMVNPEPVNILEIINQCIEEIRKKVEDKSLEIKVINEEIPIINLDPNLVTIIFQNLITNSIKYTNKGGKIEIVLSIIKKGSESAGISALEDELLIKVIDNGIGIPSNQKSKIFGKLFRADNVKKADTEGTGLGLYMVKELIERSRGNIWFESEENKGTTFFVTLPLSGMEKKLGTRKLDDIEA